jgi:peptidoglycan/LPS O-acetylase OafA/YrhL
VRPRFRVVALVGLGLLWVAVATRWWVLDPRPRDLVQYLVWFAMGALAPTMVRRTVARCTDAHALAAIGVFVLATAELRQYGPVSYPVLQVLGVVTGLAVAARLRGPAIDRLAGLGRRTLPIYVLHVPLLTVWTWATRRLGWHGQLSSEGLHWVYPLVLTAALVAMSLSIERAIRRVGGGRVFDGTAQPALA